MIRTYLSNVIKNVIVAPFVAHTVFTGRGKK